MSYGLIQDVSTLEYNKEIYKDLQGMSPEQHARRFSYWWAWAGARGLNEPEFLFPQLRVPTEIAPFTFERRFADSGLPPPSAREIGAKAPWAYQIEFGKDISTLGVRQDAEWRYHRYRASLLVETAAAIAGDDIGRLSVLDVASHCGVFSLEMAERGFKHVDGIDLRDQNIDQARFLADVFRIRNVSFSRMNVWDCDQLRARDVVFCGGLLYHVTYPMKLLSNLYDLTSNFLIFDTLTHKYPFSGFHLVCNKDTKYSAEGEFHYELHPTYRAVCDGLQAVGFRHIYELIGDPTGVPNYDTCNVRSFVAAKHDDSHLLRFIRTISRR